LSRTCRFCCSALLGHRLATAAARDILSELPVAPILSAAGAVSHCAGPLPATLQNRPSAFALPLFVLARPGTLRLKKSLASLHGTFMQLRPSRPRPQLPPTSFTRRLNRPQREYSVLGLLSHMVAASLAPPRKAHDRSKLPFAAAGTSAYDPPEPLGEQYADRLEGLCKHCTQPASLASTPLSPHAHATQRRAPSMCVSASCGRTDLRVCRKVPAHAAGRPPYDTNMACHRARRASGLSQPRRPVQRGSRQPPGSGAGRDRR
jgi:hypothetical protein